MLRPTPVITPEALAQGQRHLVLDLGWASVSGAFSGGVILAAFALALNATPLQIGLLAAIPFIAQALQLPATLMIERVRQRRLIAVVSITAARVLMLAMALLPLLPVHGGALGALIGVQVLIASLNAVGACSMSSWLHQLIPHGELGTFFARRLFSGTTFACAATLAAGALVDHWHGANPLHAYGAAFAIAGLTGFVSSFHIARTPEPQMQQAGPPVRVSELLRLPFADRNFRRLLVFMGAWTIASNIVAPFLTVYLIRQRNYTIGTVTHLWVVSQLANALTLYVWGRLSDRLSNKAVLDTALPVYFASILALVFVGAFQPRSQLALLYLIHLAMGVASGGIGLAIGNLGLKLAPHGKATAYLASIGLVCAIAGGIAPIAAGAIAETLKYYQVSGLVRWYTPGSSGEKPILTFAHWEFLFAISTALGFYVMHALSRISEGDEVSEHRVVQEFALEAARSLNSLSSVAGALGNLFPFERLTDRRKWWRERT